MIPESEVWHIRGAQLLSKWRLKYLPGRMNASSVEKVVQELSGAAGWFKSTGLLSNYGAHLKLR